MKKSKIYLASSMLIFGSIGLFVKNINLSSAQIALMRGIIGSIFILIISFATKQKLSWKAIRPNLILLLISGSAIGLNWILLFESYRYTTIANATLSYYFAPVLVMFLAPFVLKERLTVKKFAGIIAAVIGMFLIIGIGNEPGKNHLLGIGFGLMAAVLYAAVVLMNKFLRGLSGLEMTIMQLSTASVILIPYVLLTDKIQLAALSLKTVLLLLQVGIINTGLAYLLYFSGMKGLSAQTIAVYCYIDPISAILMSSILLGERMTFVQIVGGILILGATFINEFEFGKELKIRKLWSKSERF